MMPHLCRPVRCHARSPSALIRHRRRHFRLVIPSELQKFYLPAMVDHYYACLVWRNRLIKPGLVALKLTDVFNNVMLIIVSVHLAQVGASETTLSLISCRAKLKLPLLEVALSVPTVALTRGWSHSVKPYLFGIMSEINLISNALLLDIDWLSSALKGLDIFYLWKTNHRAICRENRN